MKKKKIVISTDFTLSLTGFGRAAKSIIEYLYKTGKFDITHICVGTLQGSPPLESTPWTSIGAINPTQLQMILSQNQPQAAEHIQRMASYGSFQYDEIVKNVKPSAFIAIQDIWGIDFTTSAKWFDKITSVLWTTLDSRPILPSAIAAAKKSKHFWNWNKFSTIEMQKLGLNNVKTVYGTIDCKPFFPLKQSEKLKIRQENNILPTDIIFGFVGRNQLRKGFPNLIEGFSIFKQQNPEIKNIKLFFHTHFFEGWDIPKFCKAHNIPIEQILTTYICKNCKKYEIKHFQGNDLNCKYCRAEKSCTTTSPGLGVTETELNEIYSIINFYLHPITSGGLEIPFAIESKLCGIPGAITNYACGEDFCNCAEESGTFPIDYSDYIESTGTDFQKSYSLPSSIAKVMKKFYFMDKKDIEKMGKTAREFALKTFSIEIIGKQIEDFLDAAPLIEDESIFNDTSVAREPNAQVDDSLPDEEWICSLYKNILKVEPDRNGGIAHWMGNLKNGMSRQDVKKVFQNIANNDNQKMNKVTFEDFLDKNDKKRVLVAIPQSAGDCYLATSLFKSIRNRYKKEDGWTFYVASNPEFKSIFQGNKYLDKWIPYQQVLMDNLLAIEGNSINKGYFDVYYPIYYGSQRLINYPHNSQDVSDINVKEKE